MKINKVLLIVFCTVLSFQVRRSQSRCFQNDEATSNTFDEKGNVEQLNAQECICFPKNQSGISISKYLSLDEEPQERLVVYFYKRSMSKDLTVFIPNLAKQLIIPDLTFDTGDKLETIKPEGIVDLLHKNKEYFTKAQQGLGTNPGSIIPDAGYVLNPNLPDVGFPNVLETDNQQGNHIHLPVNENQYPMEKPALGESTVFLNAPDIHKIIPGFTPNQDLNLSLGNKWPQINPASEFNHKYNRPLENQNQQIQSTIDFPDGLTPDNLLNLNPHVLPENVITTLLTASPENLGQLISNNRSLSNLLWGPQNQSLGVTPIPKDENKRRNMPIYQSPALQETAVKYILPQYVGLLRPPTSSGIANTGWLDAARPNIPGHYPSVSVGPLPNNYQHPTFNEWFTKQIKNIEKRLKKPSMSNVIDFNSLKLLLVQALHKNGIRFSANGELYDSNGNVLKMTNLKLRPILLGDPMDYEQLITSNKCMIPHDIPYLEAILVSLVDPPKILAIIPLGKVFVSISQDRVTPSDHNKKLLGKPKCQLFRGLAEKKEPISAPNINTFSDYYHENLLRPDVRSGEMEENEDIPPKDIPIYKDTPLETNPDNWNNLLPSLTPSGRRQYGGQIIYLDEGNYLEERKSSKDIDVPQAVAKQPITEDDELLTIRIVGGNPATSSGTPVSSKGRSGANE